MKPLKIQEKVHSNKGLEEARVSFSPVSDTVTHAFYDHVVVSHSTPRRLLQNVNDLTDFAWTRELPFAKHEFHDKRVLESFEAVDRETSSGSRTNERALHGSVVISCCPHRRVLAEFSVLPTFDVFTLPGSTDVQFSDGPGNKSRKKANANSIFSSARPLLRAEVPASSASSDVVRAPPDGGPYAGVFFKHLLVSLPFLVATSPRWPHPVLVCHGTAAPLRRAQIPDSAARRLLLSATATSAGKGCNTRLPMPG